MADRVVRCSFGSLVLEPLVSARPRSRPCTPSWRAIRPSSVQSGTSDGTASSVTGFPFPLSFLDRGLWWFQDGRSNERAGIQASLKQFIYSSPDCAPWVVHHATARMNIKKP